MFKSLSEAGIKDRERMGKPVQKKKPDMPSGMLRDLVSPPLSSPHSSMVTTPQIESFNGFICVRCSGKIRLPEEGNDVCCRCGSVYPYKAAKALYESQHKTGE